MAAAKTYRVLNPRGIPSGIHILMFEREDFESGSWLEGAEFVKPTGMTQASVDLWVSAGFLEETNNG